ncbi:MAG: DUF302 domain-containing protein [Hyphomicrobiaceae bacterium]
MFRRLLAVAVIAMLASPALASDQLKVIESKYSVKETLDRLTNILKSKGIKVMARVNHAAGAKSAGLELSDTELLIFGNPKLGTPLMQSKRSIAIDLPMKALAWKDAAGKVHLAYTAPEALKARHGVEGRDAIFGKMTKALAGLTAAAAGAK